MVSGRAHDCRVLGCPPGDLHKCQSPGCERLTNGVRPFCCDSCDHCQGHGMVAVPNGTPGVHWLSEHSRTCEALQERSAAS
jgi:hypothetical protein